MHTGVSGLKTFQGRVLLLTQLMQGEIQNFHQGSLEEAVISEYTVQVEFREKQSRMISR